MQIIIIGIGNSETNLISQTLSASGIYVGKTNASYDMVPKKQTYEAIKLAGPLVKRTGAFNPMKPEMSALNWDFSKLLDSTPPAKFVSSINQYISQLDGYEDGYSSWKLTESILVLPWLIKMFPDAYYIYWIRDPRDCILGRSTIDRLQRWRIPSVWYAKPIDGSIESWAYQYNMTQSVFPQNVIRIKYEDFILNQASTLTSLSTFLNIPMVSIPVSSANIGLYKKARPNNFPPQILQEAGYI